MNRFAAFAVLSVSFGLLGGASAMAADNNVTMDKVSVAYGDLNLSSQAGAHALLSRVRSAAALVCGGQPDIRDIRGMDRFQACKKDAIASAVTRIGAPMVAALNGQPVEQVASAR